jgi:putative spermidine/putrescine transport system substrate-binding protein
VSDNHEEKVAEMKSSNSHAISRRLFLSTASASVAAPYVWSRSAHAAQQVIVRTSGGEADDVRREVMWKPFTKLTDIEVVPIAANSAKLLAAFKAGKVEVDVNDNDNSTFAYLAKQGALQAIPYKDFKFSDLNDVDKRLVHEFYVAQGMYATVLGFNTKMFPSGKEPQSWAEFWDLKRFPGPRMLADIQSDNGNLEFALLADGVPADELYPLDIDRAFKSLSHIRPAIPKFWTSGALSAQMLSDQEVNMGSIWNTRLAVAASKGAPLAAQWNQNQVAVQSFAIMKGAPNLDNAVKFVDFSLSVDVQKNMVAALKFIPANRKVYESLPKDIIDPATGTPYTISRGFFVDVDWWADNYDRVAAQWGKWIAQ